MTAVAAEYGCLNINSGAQIATALASLGVELTERTKTGQICTDSHVLRGLLTHGRDHVRRFIRAVLTAKQVSKRQQSYTWHFLSQRDTNDRIHPSINTLGARTARMSVSNPALQQLPTKEREDEI
jgi:DNA polymerase-1